MTNIRNIIFKFLQNACLNLYRIARRSGILETSFGRLVFEKAYETYKLRLEASMIDQLKPWVKQGSVAIDVGANIGFFTRRFTRWVGDNGHVIAIEPEENNIRRLKNVLEKTGSAKCVDIVCAVAAEAEGELLLKVNLDHPGDHQISDHGVPVKAVTLDNILAEKNWPVVSFIKIDVQGAEIRVLDGAKELIKRYAPVLFVEVDEHALKNHGVETDTLINRLILLGYNLHILEGGILSASLDLSEIKSLLKTRGAYMDLLCISQKP